VRHDPERLAAEFLSGELGRARRRLVERHLLDCDACWAEVAQARRGRQTAEALRDVAPPGVRDRIRAVVDLDSPTPPPGRPARTAVRPLWRVLAGSEVAWRRRAALVAGLLAVCAGAVATAVLLTSSKANPAGRQPALVAALVQAYRDNQPGGEPAADQRPPTERADGYVWIQARRTTLAGQPMIVHQYLRADGARILLARAQTDFPHPGGVRLLPDGGWLADIDGVRLYCTSRAGPTLVLGEDPTAVAALAHAGR
jgi:anti-sigma factor RsiW